MAKVEETQEVEGKGGLKGGACGGKGGMEDGVENKLRKM